MSADLWPRFREREQLDDPGFESWASGSALNYWTPTAVVTVAQEATEKYEGSYSCKATRSDGGSFGALDSRNFNLAFNAWYYVGVRAKGTVAVSNAVRLMFQNVRTGLSWNEATDAWAASGSVFRNSITYDYTVADAWVKLDSAVALPTDTYFMRLAGYWTGTDTDAAAAMFYDAATILGPYAKPISRVGLLPLTYHGEGFRLGAFH